MTAKLAPSDVFSQTGLDYSPVLRDLRFTVEKRANGQSVVKVSSVKPINEPFLDFLVELNWPAGRLVREYTFLLDPPELANKGAAGQMSVAEARVVETVRAGRPETAAKPAVAPSLPAQPAAPKSRPASSEAKKADAAGSHVVQSGETLRKIAAENKPEGVSLEQMLVALFKNNPDAFVGQNINRLKAGAILGLPDKAAVESVSEAEARKVYVAQAADWNAYRQKLAAATAKAPARDDAAAQNASGKIVAKVEEKAPVAEQTKDQVKVSKTEVAGKGASAAKGATEADQVAKDKALKEAQDRLALLEKNVGELQKLLDMKSQKLAELQQAGAKKEEPKVPEAKPAVEPVKPVEPAKPVEAEKQVEAAKPAEAPKPVEVAKPAEAAPVAEPKKAAEPAPALPAPPPAPVVEEEAGMLDSLLADPLPLAGGAAGILALLGGYLAFKRRRQQQGYPETTAAPGPSSLGPNSVFRMTGGQSVDTANTPPQTGDFSQTGPGTIDTDEVDPVAEADVYMAYGRDTQAEEILLEALQKDPQRTAIHTKLLEIYANRRSVKQFETLASELYAQTGGAGPDWAKVVAMGSALDPENPLYSGASAVPAPAFDADATLVVTAEDIGALATSTEAAAEMPAPVVAFAADEPLPSGFVDTKAFEPLQMAVPEEPVAEEPAAEEIALDLEALDLSSGQVQPQEESAALVVDEDDMSLDFDLGQSLDEDHSAAIAEALEAGAPEVVLDAAPDEAPEALPVDEPYVDTFVTGDGNALDFDLKAARSDLGQPAPEAPPADMADEIDPSVVDIDFGLASKPVAEVSLDALLGNDAAEAADVSPDFSPEGTLVMTGTTSDFGVTTFVGIEEPSEPEPEAPPPFEDMPAVDFDLDTAPAASHDTGDAAGGYMDAAATVVNPQAVASLREDVAGELLQTSVNPVTAEDDSLEFDMKLTDSVFLGEPVQPDFDIGSINLDLSAEPAASPAQPMPAESAPDVPAAPGVVHDASWEEVNTKLDLAKAYEEMGDIEGARELLQEVLAEGTSDLVDEANSILGRIGG